MDSMILKKKLDGFRTSNGSMRDVSPEVLWELRQAWENFTGPIDQFRSELGIQTGTLRNLLSAAKKLNHVMASAGSVALSEQWVSRSRELLSLITVGWNSFMTGGRRSFVFPILIL